MQQEDCPWSARMRAAEKRVRTRANMRCCESMICSWSFPCVLSRADCVQAGGNTASTERPLLSWQSPCPPPLIPSTGVLRWKRQRMRGPSAAGRFAITMHSPGERATRHVPAGVTVLTVAILSEFESLISSFQLADGGNYGVLVNNAGPTASAVFVDADCNRYGTDFFRKTVAVALPVQSLTGRIAAPSVISRPGKAIVVVAART